MDEASVCGAGTAFKDGKCVSTLDEASVCGMGTAFKDGKCVSVKEYYGPFKDPGNVHYSRIPGTPDYNFSSMSESQVNEECKRKCDAIDTCNGFSKMSKTHCNLVTIEDPSIDGAFTFTSNGPSWYRGPLRGSKVQLTDVTDDTERYVVYIKPNS